MKLRSLLAAVALAASMPAQADVIGTLLVDDLHIFAAGDNIDTLHFMPSSSEMVEFKLKDLEFPAPLDFSAFIIHQGSHIVTLGLGPAEGVTPPPNPVSRYFNVTGGLPYQLDILAVPNPQKGFDFGVYHATVEVIPEAETWLLMALGFVVVGARLMRGRMQGGLAA